MKKRNRLGNLGQSRALEPRIVLDASPVANHDLLVYEVNEDVPLEISSMDGVLANDTDADGNALTAALQNGPASGDLALNGDGSFVYTPEENFNGFVLFNYKVNDGTSDSETAWGTIKVNAVNDIPEANHDLDYTTAHNTPLEVSAEDGVLANDTDVDGDALTARLIAGPTSGELDFNEDGSFTYTPEEGFEGLAAFIYAADDGHGGCKEAVAVIEVGPANPSVEAPVAEADVYEATEDQPLTIEAETGVLANDTAEGDMVATVQEGPAHGTLELNEDGSFSYTPDENFNGEDSFTYLAQADGQETEATVTINVAAVNDAPVSEHDLNYVGTQDTVLTIEDATGVLANDMDVDGDILSAMLVEEPTGGTVTLNETGGFEFIPDPGFSGVTGFTYIANDGTVDGTETVVGITINAVTEPDDGGVVDPTDPDDGGVVDPTDPDDGGVVCPPPSSCVALTDAELEDLFASIGANDLWWGRSA